MCLTRNCLFVTKMNRLMLQGNLPMKTSSRLVGVGGIDADYSEDHTNSYIH